MEKLPDKFNSKGHDHELVKRQGDVAIYKRWSKATEWTQPMPHFEVVIVKKQQAGAMTAGGSTFELKAKELYPNEKDWGTFGWSFFSLAEAERKFAELAAT